MSMASPEIQELARQLLAFEAVRIGASDAPEAVAVRVIGELRLRLIKLAGVDGFHSLLSRALAKARGEESCLNAVHISADGSLVGFGSIGQNTGDSLEAREQAGLVLVAHLLELLVIFIGESLTLGLVHDSWPEASISGLDWKTGENP